MAKEGSLGWRQKAGRRKCWRMKVPPLPPEAEELLGSVFTLIGAKKHGVDRALLFWQKRRGRTMGLGTSCSRCAWEQVELLWPHLPFGIPPHIQGPGRQSHLLSLLHAHPPGIAICSDSPQVRGETSAMTCWWRPTPSPTPCHPW